jgi:two-component system sensor histidine kinase UhpB
MIKTSRNGSPLLRQRLGDVSILARILIGNALVIVGGAVTITLVVRRLTGEDQPGWLVWFLVLLGITISIFLSYLITRIALRPLRQLERYAQQVQREWEAAEKIHLENPDPGTWQVGDTLDVLLNQLAASNRQLRAISTQVINAQEEERKRIARSLHDDTGQALSTLIINLERLEGYVPEDDREIKTRLAGARELANDILDGLRSIVHGLRPAILDDLGLVPAIRWYARSNLEAAGIQVSLDLPAEPLSLSPELSTTLFRITQEGVNNIVRHSNAEKAVLSLVVDKQGVYLGIEDDGRGFSVAEDRGEAIRLHQWGLVGIRERVELVGGEVNLISDPGSGTVLQVYAPLSKNIEDLDGQYPNHSG